MKYAKYNYYLNSETNEKELPSQAEGVCYTDSNETQIIGYLEESADISLLAKYSIIELTESEFFDLLLLQNADATMVDGRAIVPVLLN
jgi:hypothetical protein